MTQLVEKALSEAAKLPPAEQDALAAILLNELASEKRWAESFAKSREALAREALADGAAGLAKPFLTQVRSEFRMATSSSGSGSVR